MEREENEWLYQSPGSAVFLYNGRVFSGSGGVCWAGARGDI